MASESSERVAASRAWLSSPRLAVGSTREAFTQGWLARSALSLPAAPATEAKCPGESEYGHGLSRTVVHGACCATPRAVASEGEERTAWEIVGSDGHHVDFYERHADAVGYLKHLTGRPDLYHDQPYRVVPLYARPTPPLAETLGAEEAAWQEINGVARTIFACIYAPRRDECHTVEECVPAARAVLAHLAAERAERGGKGE